jgi:hypothetical protein
MWQKISKQPFLSVKIIEAAVTIFEIPPISLKMIAL